MSYQRDEVKAPRVSGFALKALAGALESAAGPVLAEKLVRDSGIARFRATSAGRAPATQAPLPHPVVDPAEVRGAGPLAERAAGSAGRLETVAAFAQAYRERRATPPEVVARLHAHLEQLDRGDQRLGLFISRRPEVVLRDAEASAARLAAGTPRGVFEGVPVVLKDEVDLAGFPTTLGTGFLSEPAAADSAVAARLKAAGAVIVGKANMNEIGINPLGTNPHHGAARNPWNPGCHTGGSSSGPAAVVAAGVCPVAVGADGGGSIRIPAALCGVVGLKPTFGRVPEAGVPPLCWNVAHLGPLGLTVADVAAAYAVLAGPDAGDPMSLGQPPVHLTGYEEGELTGVRVGLAEGYFADAEPEVVARCREAVAALTARGAVVVPVPEPDLNTVLWAHSVIILSEMAEAMLAHTTRDAGRFALDSRVNLALGRHFSATDLVHAMRHRHALTRHYLEVLREVDVLVTPTTACAAPALPLAALPDGESNLVLVDALMRFVRLGNLTGFPALAVPCGFDARGLPVSVQLMGRPWEEHLLLRLGRVVEAGVERRTPAVHVTLL